MGENNAAPTRAAESRRDQVRHRMVSLAIVLLGFAAQFVFQAPWATASFVVLAVLLLVPKVWEIDQEAGPALRAATRYVRRLRFLRLRFVEPTGGVTSEEITIPLPKALPGSGVARESAEGTARRLQESRVREIAKKLAALPTGHRMLLSQLSNGFKSVRGDSEEIESLRSLGLAKYVGPVNSQFDIWAAVDEAALKVALARDRVRRIEERLRQLVTREKLFLQLFSVVDTSELYDSESKLLPHRIYIGHGSLCADGLVEKKESRVGGIFVETFSLPPEVAERLERLSGIRPIRTEVTLNLARVMGSGSSGGGAP